MPSVISSRENVPGVDDVRGAGREVQTEQHAGDQVVDEENDPVRWLLPQRSIARHSGRQRPLRHEAHERRSGLGVADERRIAADHTDGFGAGFEIHPLTIDLILVRVFRINALDVKVHDIWTDVGEAPGHLAVAAPDQHRQADEEDAAEREIHEREVAGDGAEHPGEEPRRGFGARLAALAQRRGDLGGRGAARAGSRRGPPRWR